MAYQQSYYQSGAIPITVHSSKEQSHYAKPQQYHYAYTSSPPEVAESVTTGTGPYGRSTYSVTTNSYAGSMSGDFESTASANSINMQEYMQNRFHEAFDPLALDRNLAMQTQTSGLLNAKTRELRDLQALAQQRLARTRARLAEGYQDAKEVKQDLEWSQKRISTLKSKSSRKHPAEYKQARARYPSPEY